ncbi:MAG: 8-oxo-dGTP pyrophosphatase MutT (NUDIX family) [Saprospiraceae bacterium]|jgi:8-oxo-dGTP pyrophosphatase MutT (NUDIX family)|tara:strand:+ start:1247 stop:2299 length:1053 start_codon:yes stop_codon:yes gene_type:complete
MDITIHQLIKDRNETAIILHIKENPPALEIKDVNGVSVFATLAYHGLSKAFEFACSIKENFSFHESIISGRIGDLSEHLEKNDVNFKSDDGFTPIALAAFFNHTEIARQLLYEGADPNIKADNPSMVNALHAAVARENLDLVQLFLNHNADANATQMQGVTPLHSAVKRRNLGLVKLLITYGADTNLTMANGDNAGKIAIEENLADIGTFLEETSNKQPLKEIDKIAWIEIKNKKLLSTKSIGKTAYYIPGGKRDPGENDTQTLVREIKEELSVGIVPETIKYMGTYKAQADGHTTGIIVRMTCYTADYAGGLATANEIEELKWLEYHDYDKISHVDKVIFDHLHFLNRI